MKQFLKSALYIALLLSTAIDAKHRRSSDCCPTTCATTCPTTTTTTAAGCPSLCNNNFNNCGTGVCNTGTNNCNTSFNNCNTGCNTGSNCDTGRHHDRNHHDRRSSECCFTDCASEAGRGYTLLRSQNDNLARQMAGFVTLIDRPDVGQMYGAGYVAYEYQRSFRNRRLVRSTFGTDTLLFQGSAVPGVRPPTAFVAEYFGLPSTFVGSVNLCPRIENHIVELGGYFNFSECPEGGYFKIFAPIAHTKWRIHPTFCDNSCSTTFAPFPACTFSTTSSTCPVGLGSALTGAFTGATECGGFFDSFCSRSRTKLADLKLILGYNFWNNDCGHLGLYLIGVAPTGTRTRNVGYFHPQIGNGHHGELGIGIQGQAVLWDDNCGDQTLSMYFDGYVTHMFKSRQCRTLDFCNRPYSRFLLLREFQNDGVTPTGSLVSATCFNRRAVDVSVNAKGEGALMFAYNYCGFGFDLGYNIYGHTREKIRFRNECRPCDADTRKFGIAGSTGVCCTSFPVSLGSFVVPTVPGVAGCTVISGGATGINLSNATFSGANVFTPTTNSLPDNPVTFAGAPAATSVCLNPGVSPAVGTLVPVTPTPLLCSAPAGYPSLLASELSPISSRPVLVGVNDLDPHSAQAHAVLTHKIFGNLRYTWADDCGYNPTVSVGGEIEFERNCEKQTLNQFGVWVKLATSF